MMKNTTRKFPSYNEIHKNILNQVNKKQLKKINELQQKISKIQKDFNLQEQHKQIKQKLLQNYYSNNRQVIMNVLMNNNQQNQKLQKDHMIKNLYQLSSTINNHQSLNYCIDDQIEEQNHYQNHLKFKKQVLQRDLFQNAHKKNKNHKNKYDEQQIFKNLYTCPFTATGSSAWSKYKKPSHNPLPLNKNTNSLSNVGINKQNRLNPSKNNYSKPRLSQTQSVFKYCQNFKNNREITDIVIKNQLDICKNNAKILKDNYSKYLKQLENTHIIKERILCDDL